MQIIPTSTDEKTENIISEEVIGNRAFEICRKNSGSDFKEPDNWRFAVRGLKGF